MNKAVAKVESIAEQLVFLDTGDWQALSQFQEELNGLAVISPQELQPLSRQAVAVVEAIIFEQAPDSDQARSWLDAAITAMQRHLRDGVPIAECDIPRSPEWAPVEAAADDPVETTETDFDSDDSIIADFRARARASLEDLEPSLAALEEDPSDNDAIAEIRRIIHTIKGEAGMLSFDEYGHLCTAIEDAIGDDELRVPVAALVQARDWLLDDVTVGGAMALASELPDGNTPDLPSVLAQLRVDHEDEPALDLPGSLSLTADATMLSEFVGEAHEHMEGSEVHLLELETDAHNQDALNGLFRAFHTIKGLSGFLDLNPIQSLAHTTENLLDHCRKGDIDFTPGRIDLVFEAIDAIKSLVESIRDAIESGRVDVSLDSKLASLHLRIEASNAEVDDETEDSLVAAHEPQERLGDILIEQGVVSPEHIEDALAHKQEGERLGEALVREHAVSAKQVSSALRSQRMARTAQIVKESVKVDALRLDRLVDAIGELVIAETMVSEDGGIRSRADADPDFAKRLNLLGKITRELQEIATSLRMVPVKATFQRMARLARDVSSRTGKKVVFATAGDDTELDKNVVDRIGDPLVHMVRNAIDHGIETDPSERVALGKSEQGTVELRAFHKGGSICIQIRDDGKGLDRNKLFAKALDRGLVREGEELTDADVYKLVFHPGFSTRDQVSDLSGRGVGMDVVKKAIDALRGQIEIESAVGSGTTFTIRLPLTLAIIDGMVCGVGRERYIIPTLGITMSLRPEPHQVVSAMGRGEMLTLHGEVLPLFRLHRLFDIAGAKTRPEDALLVVLEIDGIRTAIMVDTLLGQQQIVIKSLGSAMKTVKGVAGGAIMSDGTVGLIVDPTALLELAQGDGLAPVVQRA